MSSNPLSQKKCKPCKAGATGRSPLLSRKQAEKYLIEIPGWSLSEDGKWIRRQIIVKNFVAAVDFINNVKDIAEDDDHHPDIHLTGYRNVTIELSTHAIGGLSENDFILAAKINELKVTE